MSPQLLVFAAVLMLMSALYSYMPALTRGDLYFAVTVQPSFRSTLAGRRIHQSFRTVVLSAATAATVFALADLPVWAIVIQGVGMIGAFVYAHHRTLRHAAAPNPVVEVDLGAPREQLAGGLLAAWAPPVFLAGLGLWIFLHWGRLPARLPVHWGLHGADHWVRTTPAGVIAFLAVQGVTCLTLALGAWALLNWTRRISLAGPAAAGERRFRRRVAQLMVVTEYLMVFPAWAAFFQPSPVAMEVWTVALVAVIIGFTVSLLRQGQGGSRAAAAIPSAAPAGDRTPDDCWKWGLIYINPADPSILVEKRFGIGYTLNLGNRWSWLVMALLIAPGVGAVIFLR